MKNCQVLLSFAFNCNLRRCFSVEKETDSGVQAMDASPPAAAAAAGAGAVGAVAAAAAADPSQPPAAVALGTLPMSAGDAPPDETPKILSPEEQAKTNRCFSCNKRVGFTGFKCRCEYTFCSTHRHSGKHECSFDYKALGRDSVAKVWQCRMKSA